MKTYSDKLKDPRWQKKRLEILNRDQFICQGCMDTETTLHVHHKYYNDCDPWDIPDSALVTLCESCHDDETRSIKNELNLVQRSIADAGGMSWALNLIACTFSNAHPKPLDERDWSILLKHVENILIDRNKNGKLWNKIFDDFYKKISKSRKKAA